MAEKMVLISGGGIAGLTLAICLKELGWDPVVVEREPSIRTEGYMMDFFGTGWDVAERMGLVDSLRAIQYPIDSMQYVDGEGRPWLSVPIKRVAEALGGKYTYLRRSDLERVLFARATQAGASIRFGKSVRSIEENASGVRVTFENGETETFTLVVGADGVHSRVRELVFGPETQFSRYLGYYVAAFHILNHGYTIGRAFQLYEEIGRVASFYPLNESTMDATYVFRLEDAGFIAPNNRLGVLREKFKGARWIAEQILHDYASTEPIFFDSLTQIKMPSWHKGRVALIGDACGCLTLLAGQGSHLAMAGAYVLANELSCHRGDYRLAFERYQNILKPAVEKKQAQAVRLSRRFVPSPSSNMPLRRTMMKLIFNKLVLKYVAGFLGGKSILGNYR